uniref:Uncharacterized protein n=1 Tax=Vitrella brassicaformis TaxID=1169539 RepID=A0A7S1KFB9_9ALVE|mmetsp:Transcript_4938/g.11521  ORF Transcript_4938/g.11521 Transcript_4938/m.11521 type:complete len:121 (+) Transcript_4938:85-447(+)
MRTQEWSWFLSIRRMSAYRWPSMVILLLSLGTCVAHSRVHQMRVLDGPGSAHRAKDLRASQSIARRLAVRVRLDAPVNKMVPEISCTRLAAELHMGHITTPQTNEYVCDRTPREQRPAAA